MATEKVITPRPYTYGKLNREGNREATVKIGADSFTIGDVSRYYLSADGSTLTVHIAHEKKAVLKIIWSPFSSRVIVHRLGSAPIITNGVTATITENGRVIVTS